MLPSNRSINKYSRQESEALLMDKEQSDLNREYEELLGRLVLTRKAESGGGEGRG
jgi:hypothetical protein